jgi:arsenate reductase
MNKPKVAFICVHNACRSQIAQRSEASCRRRFRELFRGDHAQRAHRSRRGSLKKRLYGIDMEQGQSPKLHAELPPIDVVITMGCNVEGPYLSCKRRENWGLFDPTGKSDEEFIAVIQTIETKIAALAKSLR